MEHIMQMQNDPNMPQFDPDVAAAAGAAALGAFLLIYAIIFIIFAIGLWKMFSKAGIPGILAFIPIVNLFFIPQVGGKPAWWGIMLLLPIINVVFLILTCLAIAERFGRGVGTVLGLIFLPMIFTCILGFGSAKWTPAPAQG
jgi:hypothetical protein